MSALRVKGRLHPAYNISVKILNISMFNTDVTLKSPSRRACVFAARLFLERTREVFILVYRSNVVHHLSDRVLCYITRSVMIWAAEMTIFRDMERGYFMGQNGVVRGIILCLKNFHTIEMFRISASKILLLERISISRQKATSCQL